MRATVERLEYDPNRSAYIALIKYEDSTFSYILAPKDQIQFSFFDDLAGGSGVRLPLPSVDLQNILSNL